MIKVAPSILSADFWKLGGGTLDKVVTGSGIINTTADITSDAINLGNIVKNDYQLTLTGDITTGVLSKAIAGNGTVIVNGDITSNVSILNNITINED